MILTGLARLGNDAQLRTAGQDKVANLSLAFNYGKKDDQGKRPTQWVDASIWGTRAEKLVPYLKKGTAVSVTLDEPHIEQYEGRTGPGHKLVARVLTLEFAGKPGGAPAAASGAAPAAASAPKPAAQQQPPPEDDDIPF